MFSAVLHCLRRPVVVGLAATVAVAQVVPHAASGQSEREVAPLATGPWLSASAVIGRALLDQNSARGWERVGDFGLSVGAALSAGYDVRRVGLALELEATNVRVGSRPGGNLALAALVRAPAPWQPFSSRQTHLAAGYVRYGLGGAFVLPAELPAGYFHSIPSPFADDSRLMLVGNGVRLGFSSDHAFSPRSGLVVSIGTDIVHFGTATYQHLDQTLSEPGWGVMPRLAVGLIVTPHRQQ